MFCHWSLLPKDPHPHWKHVSVCFSTDLLKDVVAAPSSAPGFGRWWMNTLHTFTRKCFYSRWFSIQLGKYQRMSLLNCVVRQFSFVRSCQIVFKVAVLFCIPTSDKWEFVWFHILTSVWSCQCCIFCSNRCTVVSHCFTFQFPNDIWYWASFHMLIPSVQLQ